MFSCINPAGANDLLAQCVSVCFCVRVFMSLCVYVLVYICAFLPDFILERGFLALTCICLHVLNVWVCFCVCLQDLLGWFELMRVKN